MRMPKSVHGVAPITYMYSCNAASQRQVSGRPQLKPASTGCIQLHRVQTSIGKRRFAFWGPELQYGRVYRQPGMNE